MGEGHVGGNGSVKWTFEHHENGARKNIRARNGGQPGPHEVSDEGGNAQGYDPISFSEIGRRHGVVGYFKVTLAGHPNPFYVSAVDRSGGKGSDVPPEIKIEW
jgi:hypothetical protein